MSEWTESVPMKKGDSFTISGRFKRRTLWQWLNRQDRELQVFEIMETVVAGGVAEYRPATNRIEGD